MAVARLFGFEVDFVRNAISGSAARFFVIILKFISTPIFDMKPYEKKSLTLKKFHFGSLIFNNQYIKIVFKVEHRKLKSTISGKMTSREEKLINSK